MIEPDENEPFDVDLDMTFNPEADEEQAPYAPFTPEPAKTPADLDNKALKLASNAMDALNQKILDGGGETGDFRTALEFAKWRKVGIESVEDLAKRALAETDTFEDVEESDGPDDDMRFAD